MCLFYFSHSPVFFFPFRPRGLLRYGGQSLIWPAEYSHDSWAEMIDDISIDVIEIGSGFVKSQWRPSLPPLFYLLFRNQRIRDILSPSSVFLLRLFLINFRHMPFDQHQSIVTSLLNPTVLKATPIPNREKFTDNSWRAWRAPLPIGKVFSRQGRSRNIPPTLVASVNLISFRFNMHFNFRIVVFVFI